MIDEEQAQYEEAMAREAEEEAKYQAGLEAQAEAEAEAMAAEAEANSQPTVLTVDLADLAALITEGKDIFLKSEGEEALLKLLDLQEAIEGAIDEAKRVLEAEALKLDPQFKSIQSDNVRVYYRTYGSRYKLDESKVATLPANLYTTRTSYTVNTKEVEAFAKEKGGLPDGILEPERTKQLTFSRKGAADEE